jgi:predicted ATPase
MLLESALLREEADYYALTGPLSAVAIPSTLQDSLMARLDQLNVAKEVAQLGAVLGREFPYEMVQALGLIEEGAFQDGLVQLVAAERLYQRGRPPRARYIFKHALIQEAAYQSLLKSTRQQVHQRMVQVLEELFPETVETQPELLAHHCTAAGLYEKAVGSWRRAGQRAADRSAYKEATAHFAEALRVLQYLPESRNTMEQAIDLRFELRNALLPLGDERILSTKVSATRRCHCSNGAIHSARVGISLSGFPSPLRRWEQRIAWQDGPLKPYHC